MSMSEAELTGQGARPRLICVPPPIPGPLWRPFLFLLTCLLIAWLLVGFTMPAPLSLEVGALALVIVAWTLIAVVRVQRRVKRIRARWSELRPAWQDDPLAKRFAELWVAPESPPDPIEIEDHIRRLPDDERRTAFIVCLGIADIPHSVERRFEAEMIGPGRRWRQLLPGTLGVAFVLYVAFSCLQFRFLENRGRLIAWLASAVVFVLLVGFAWLWRAALFPTRIRIAPGVVQFLRYGFLGRKPKTVIYPIAAGTVAVMTNHSGRLSHRLVLTLVRGNELDTLALSRLGDREHVMEHVWQALLSTAPTPPLSDEELVG